MANSYFNFKQFSICQEGVGMKVSTDACIQGALAARHWQDIQPKSILDIGTGTGLLSLMLAQSLPNSLITSIEIDEVAFEKAKENFSKSKWNKNITAIQQALQDYQCPIVGFDYIICNPPFFHNHLQAPLQQRNWARHDHVLSKDVLASKVKQLLSPNGQCCMLYPQSEWEAWEKTCIHHDLYPFRIFEIKPNCNKQPNRIVGFYANAPCLNTEVNQLEIYEDSTQNYTLRFKNLLKDYYLNL